MCSLNVMNSRKTNGTSSSGALPTTYAAQWEKSSYSTSDYDTTPEIKYGLLLARHSGTMGGENYFFVLAPRSTTTANISLTSLSITQNWQRERLPAILRRISDQFYALRQRQDNWDSRGSKKPNRLSLSYAEGIINDLLNSVIEAGYLWLSPSISSDEDGNITLEWHKGKHELHIDVGEDEAEYIKVWGTNIENEMHLDFLKKQNYLSLWDWLLHG